jgi:hypothetical protein
MSEQVLVPRVSASDKDVLGTGLALSFELLSFSFPLSSFFRVDIMPSQQAATSIERQARFDHFYSELGPVLVDFIDVLGIEPPREVLTQAVQYLPYVERALQDMAIADEDDRSWLLARMMYFIGEYFAQRYSGHWFVNETPGTPTFGRCVVGKFRLHGANLIDPFELASAYVDLPCPRRLSDLVGDVEAAMSGPVRPGLH